MISARKRLPYAIQLLLAAVTVVIVVCLLYLGYRSVTTRGPYELLRSMSPDGQMVAVTTIVQEHSFPLPVPHGRTTKATYHRLRVMKDGKTVFSTEVKNLGPIQSPEFSVDLAWSPDSMRLAYRLVNSLLVIDPINQSVTSFPIVKSGSQVASFRWVSNTELVTLTKVMERTIYDTADRYEVYVEDSVQSDLWLVDVPTQEIVRLASVPTAPTTYIFRAATFQMDELSSFSHQAAIFDGRNICVYDYDKKESIVKESVEGTVEGVWWADKGTVVLSIDNLSGTTKFLKLDVTNGQISDVTQALKPHWSWHYDDMDWFRGHLP